MIRFFGLLCFTFWHGQRVVQCASPTVERHLIMQGCKETKKSEFFTNLKDNLVELIDFESVTCIASDQDEMKAVTAVTDRKAVNPDADIHFVATILQTHHCEEGACNPGNIGERYLPALRAGVIGWFIENQPDFEALEVNRTEENIRSTEVFPDNAAGGRQVGEEFCRAAASIAPATIAVLYGPPDAGHSTARIQNFIRGMNETCPEAKHNVKYSFYADWRADKAAAIMSPVFLRDGSVNAVIAANDDMALGALVSARQIRPDKKLLVGGYDANAYTIPLLESGDMFATVDQTPPSGVVYTMQTLLSPKATGDGEFGEPTDCSVNPGPTCGLNDYNMLQESAWSELVSSLPNEVSTAVAIRVKDPSKVVLRERLVLYNPKIPPFISSARANNVNPSDIKQPVPVVAALKNFQIFEVNAATSSIFGQGLLVLSWKDKRLAWSSVSFPDTEFIRVDVATIWHPVVVLSNMLSTSLGRIETVSTTVYRDGSVVWEQSISAAEYRCGTMDDTLLHFPFDDHRCGVDVTSYTPDEFTLAPTLELPDDEAFDVTITNNDWEQGATVVNMDIENTNYEVVHYRVGMARDPTFVILSLVVPSFLLNIISFAQFWIPARSDSINLDRGGMAITTILASLALREASVSEVDTAFTLLDVFLMLSLSFHFIAFLITAYESSYQQIKRSSEFQLGYADKIGKLFLPVIFGVVNMVLAIVWAKGVWSLFYLSLAEVLGCILLNQKARQGVRNSIAELSNRSNLKKKLGLGVGDSEEDGTDPESIVRYMKWRTLVSKETSQRNSSDPVGSDAEEEYPMFSGSEAVCASVDGDEGKAAVTLQRFFRARSSFADTVMTSEDDFTDNQV